MQRTSLVSALISITSITLLACGGGGGMSGGSGGLTGAQPDNSGGAPGNGGGSGTTAVVDPSLGGALGTSATGAGGASAPIGSGGAPAPIGSGGAPAPIGSGGAPAPIGSGGAPASIGSGGAPAPIGSGGAPGGSGGDSAPLSCDQDLSGTWDLFTSSVGSGIVRGTLIVSKDGFSLSTNTAQLTYDAQGGKSATWKHVDWSGSSTRIIAVQNTPTALNTGSVPLAIGGHWVLQSNTETCTLDVAADKVTGSCSGRAKDHNVGGSDWPGTLPSPENGFHYTIARGNALASQAGDLGGNWTANSDSGSTQGCNIKLEGNTATTSCRASNSFNGALHLTVGANCVASGVTPSGLEVSARRR